MKTTPYLRALIMLPFMALSIAALAANGTKTANYSGSAEMIDIPVDDAIVTAEEQSMMTPESVLKDLMEGNIRFVNEEHTVMDYSEQVRKSAAGQFPKAVVLSCLDSRIPVETVFDQGIGDLFVGRVAGNFVNEDMLGSMEFGCKVAGSRVILVMGHESCGAVKAAIDNVELGNITPMLSKIAPAVEASQDYDGERSSKNSDFVTTVSRENVLNTIKTIREKSPILKEMEDNGEIDIVGAIYNMDTGKVDFFSR